MELDMENQIWRKELDKELKELDILQIWLNRFKNCDLDMCDTALSGRSSTANLDEQMVLVD